MTRVQILAKLICVLVLAVCGPAAWAQEEEDDELLELTRQELMLLIDQRLAERDDEAAVSPEEPPAAAGSSGFDQALVSQGEAAFDSACTTCHDAERSLERRKGYAAWLATVRRMAAKADADVASSDVVPIATYLASLNPAAAPSAAGAEGDMAGLAATVDTPSVSAFATISSLWRGTNDEQLLENPGFFVDAWVGADWRPSGPVSASVVGCTSCHADQNQSKGFSLELVEASATLDLMKLICCDDGTSEHESPIDATIEAGRFIIPFGAFNAMSYPGVYRTVTNPLMFNMGRRVGPLGPLQPVLPAPFSDEGVNAHLGVKLGECWSATLDAYAINGLQDPSPRIFNSSRSYMDNNREPSVGGRVTLSNKFLKLGGSLMTGNLANDRALAVPYKLAGADATVRVHDRLRLYFEYAIRERDAFMPGRHNYAYGIVSELEADICDNVSFLVRYDTLEHRDADVGNSSLERFTYGINTSLRGGSWIAINHEHWMFPTQDIDVLAVRWTATF